MPALSEILGELAEEGVTTRKTYTADGTTFSVEPLLPGYRDRLAMVFEAHSLEMPESLPEAPESLGLKIHFKKPVPLRITETGDKRILLSEIESLIYAFRWVAINGVILKDCNSAARIRVKKGR